MCALSMSLFVLFVLFYGAPNHHVALPLVQRVSTLVLSYCLSFSYCAVYCVPHCAWLVAWLVAWLTAAVSNAGPRVNPSARCWTLLRSACARARATSTRTHHCCTAGERWRRGWRCCGTCHQGGDLRRSRHSLWSPSAPVVAWYAIPTMHFAPHPPCILRHAHHARP